MIRAIQTYPRSRTLKIPTVNYLNLDKDDFAEKELRNHDKVISLSAAHPNRVIITSELATKRKMLSAQQAAGSSKGFT